MDIGEKFSENELDFKTLKLILSIFKQLKNIIL